MEIKASIKNITCPITQFIFRHPITLSDGHTYEYEAIHNWLSTHKTSPITNKNVELHHNINYTIKSIVNEMFENKVIEENMLYPDYEINNILPCQYVYLRSVILLFLMGKNCRRYCQIKIWRN